MMLMKGVFVCVDALCPSQQFSTHVRTGLPGLNQYYAANKGLAQGHSTVSPPAASREPATRRSPV